MVRLYLITIDLELDKVPNKLCDVKQNEHT